MKQKVYIAASYTNILSAKKLGEDLEKIGYSVISCWHIEGQSPVDSDYHSSGRAIRDLYSVKQCDIFIELVGDEGSKGGRHCELGLAIAFGKNIMLVGGPDNCIFTWLPWIPRFPDVKELLTRLKS